MVADAKFLDPAHGDFRVESNSPAIGLGFVNFAMDQFGVQNAELKKIARTPEMPAIKASSENGTATPKQQKAFKAIARDISGPGDRSAYGLPGEYGVLLIKVPGGSRAAQAGMQDGDVIVECNGTQVRDVAQLVKLQKAANGKPLELQVIRTQAARTITVGK